MTPETWLTVRLGDVVTDRKDWILINDESSYRRVSARVRNQGIELRDTIVGREIRTKKQQLVRDGDFLVAEIDAKVGGMGVVPRHLDGSIVSGHYFVFSPNKDRVDPCWLAQLTRSGAFQNQVNAVGSTNYASIRRRQIHGFSLDLPPISEQRKIAAILTSVDEAIEATQAVIDQLQVVKKAMMAELLTRGLPGRHTRFKMTEIGEVPEGWALTTVGDLGAFSGGNGFRPPDWSSSGLPIIRIQNLNGSQDFNYFSGTPDPSWLVEPGELLFAWAGSRGASFGPCLWPGPLGVLNQHIYRIKPLSVVRKKYLFALLRLVTEAVEKKAHGFKDTLVHLKKSELTGWQVPLPPLPEQDGILGVIESLEARLNTESASLQGMFAAKAALLSVLLTGEVRVKPNQDRTKNDPPVARQVQPERLGLPADP